MNYDEFIASKRLAVPACGFEPIDVREPLSPFQRDITTWAVKRGRAAIFADTGLGKTRMEEAWARQVVEHTSGRVLILAPLGVTAQSVEEGERIGVSVRFCRAQSEVTSGISIANFDMLHAFDADAFDGIVLDESSILKSFDGKTRTRLIEAFARTPYKLCGTATPAPNDHTELGNHAEFLGVMSRQEMLATFFCHDGGDTQTWRLKGHAEDEFWRWLCSWGVAIRKPSDIGYDDTGYDLPPLSVEMHTVSVDNTDALKGGHLFAMQALSLNDQRAAKRASLDKRIARVAELVASESSEQWVAWCDLNDEQDALVRALGDQCVSIMGAESPESKVEKHARWKRGDARVLVSKASIFGFGMNWQHCARMAFAGVNHSYEGLYQAIRRCWRFGQLRPVNVHVVASDLEGAVIASLRRKEADAARMSAAMVSAMRETQIANVRSSERETVGYEPRVRMDVPRWLREAA